MNRRHLKDFLARRKINTLGLFIITLISLIITVICVMTGFKRSNILIMVTVFLFALCVFFYFRKKKVYTTYKYRRFKKKNA
jgi:Ca2+/Na+ antiporter